MAQTNTGPIEFRILYVGPAIGGDGRPSRWMSLGEAIRCCRTDFEWWVKAWTNTRPRDVEMRGLDTQPHPDMVGAGKLNGLA